MSQVLFNTPVDWMAGKLKRVSNISFRRNGDKVFTYTLQHPRTEADFSAHEKAYRRSFGERSRLASRICHDPAYADRFNDFATHGYLSRHKYVMALLKTEAIP